MALKTTLKSRVKIETPSPIPPKEGDPRVEKVEAQAPSKTGNRDGDLSGKPVKKYCAFCKHKNEPRYWDAASLRRFVNDRGRITARSRNGACSKHQKRVSRQVKYARHLALLPFIVRV
ncbi:MAG: 30S ribosomal protein S18 [Candidatus Daviesbacteria bacterium]|nr:30S ribosomal protein S18 [Candidatus Daviesbacteria bacterium]